MKKACKYCGGIHDKGETCPRKPVKKWTKNKDEDRFRSTQAWKDKREEIKRRDNYICRACFHNLHGTNQKINAKNLSIHHIIPIKKSWNLKLENENLITLCRYHHELAEKEIIKSAQLREIMRKDGAQTPPLPAKANQTYSGDTDRP